MALKKFRSKTRKGARKRIKVSNGGDKNKGSLIVNRVNRNHLQVKQSRKVKLRYKRNTTLGKAAEKLKAII